MALALPTTPVTPSEKLEDYSIMIFGDKRVGKTTIASSFPDSFTFRFEKGRKNLSILQVPNDDSPSQTLTWDLFIDYLESFLDSPYRRANIDSIDEAYARCYEHVCAKYGVEHPPEYKVNNRDAGYEVWADIKATFWAPFSEIIKREKTVTFLSHYKMRTHKDPAKILTKDERLEPSCTGQAIDVAKSITDFFWFAQVHNGNRLLTVRTEGGSEIGSQVLGHFLSPDNEDLMHLQIPEFDDPTHKNPQPEIQKLIWHRLNSAWNNKCYDYADDKEAAQPKLTDDPKAKSTKKKTTKKKTTKSIL